MRSLISLPGGQVVRFVRNGAKTSVSFYNNFRVRPLVSNSTVPLLLHARKQLSRGDRHGRDLRHHTSLVLLQLLSHPLTIAYPI